MDALATAQGFEITQGIVWGNYSNRKENGVKVQDIICTYELIIHERKLTLSFDAALNEIY